jgi:antirestriction protein ArdC
MENLHTVVQEFYLILLEKETGKKFWGIILNKRRINIGHQHDRWMELKEALALSAEVSTSVQLRM